MTRFGRVPHNLLVYNLPVILIIPDMSHQHFIVAILLSYCVKTVELRKDTYGNLAEALKGSCRKLLNQKPSISERCHLLENIKKYIELNLISNSVGLKLKRDFTPFFHRARNMQGVIIEETGPFQNIEHTLGTAKIDTLEPEPSSDINIFGRDAVKRDADNNTLLMLMSLKQIRDWLEVLQSARKHFSNNLDNFVKEWPALLPLEKDILERVKSQSGPVSLPLHASLTAIGLTDVFMRLFWPFRFDVSKMNQKLGVYGITNKHVENHIKSEFFKALEDIQAVEMPYDDNEIILSFDHPALVDGMNRSKLVIFSEDFIKDKKHLFSVDEQNEITSKTLEAMALIHATSPELYMSLKQLVSCLAFYKSENRNYLGGSTSSALGIIWLDPSAGEEWTVPFFAEMIVHEFIHTHLFYAELVHGTYTDNTLLSKAKVMSAIRGQLRDYDKSLHAAYVVAGLAAFHSKAGYLKRAEQLANTLRFCVDDLKNVNLKTGVLDESGTAMLNFLVDYMDLTRMRRN